MKYLDRRKFLQFLGASAYTISNLAIFESLISCNQNGEFKIPSISPSFKDDLILSEGLSYSKLISYGDKISDKEIFGFNNDFIAVEPVNANELIMWVNHEYVNPILVNGEERTKENIDKEMSIVGGSLIKVIRENGKWVYVPNDVINKGIRANTRIPFNKNIKVQGQDFAIGTLGNCAGGKTPWGTFLTCEENFQDCFGDRNRETGAITPSYLKWENFYPYPPEHYGWVVEIHPKTGAAKKHTTIGRFAHECATCVIAKAGNVVVYSGDDKNDEHLYKFISKSKNNFDQGILYVANTEKGEWLPLDLELSPILKTKFKSQIEVLTYAREASKMLGATALARPEDVEINPKTGDIFITLTNNIPKKNYHGSILKITEQNKDYNSLKFYSEVFAFGGSETGFSCPDNLAFDSNGNLWVCTDISGSSIGKDPYKPFGNNALFVIPMTGHQAGIPIQVASAPKDAELTGLCFSPDHKSLFLSVQHPGEQTKDLKNPTSHWPDGGIPKSTVVTIEGPLLEKITQGKL